jgi:hypothetical protein
MLSSEEKIMQAQRISGLSNELVQMLVGQALNQPEAKAALRIALEVVDTFPRSAYSSTQENA